MSFAYIPPTLSSKKFTCPHCAAISHHRWLDLLQSDRRDPIESHSNPIKEKTFLKATCSHCNEYTLWHIDKMVYPNIGNAPPPNGDMPESVSKIYLEAASIMNQSPRGAAALLRLAIQILCKELGEPGKNINTDIGSLVKKGLTPMVQQSLDVVRVVGNDAVHPGTIDTDSIDTVAALFKLINVIVEYMISLPSQVGNLYSMLPESKREGIEKRDAT